MPEQLKIIIDADVNKAIAGVKELSKVITADFTNATNAAAASASRLSADVAASVQKINASLSSLKITSLDVKVNTSTIDASIKSIQSKFAALVDPQINVLANTELAEVKIKELLADLSTLKGSEIFIKANDVQALKAINEIETELNSLVGKQINLSVTADLSKIEELKAKIASLKVTPVDVVLNTSSVDASIKNIQAKFNALVDPQVNILANTELAEAKIKELIFDLSTLKGSEIFIRANDAQALSAINGIEAELNSLLDKQIRLNVSTGDATQKLSLLEKELLDLQKLSVDPKISSTQLGVFEANIKRVKAEIASLKGAVVPIGIDTGAAQAKLNTLTETIETIRGKIEARKFFITVETDITKIAQYNKEIEGLEARMRSIQNVGKRGFELFVVPNQTIQSVKNLTASVAAFGGGVKTFIPPAISSFSRLSPSINSAANSLQRLPNAANASSFAMLNFGRVIQDAPFGILGIANNLNPLIESLQRASVVAKQTGTSLAANLGAALTGPAGIGIAVSAVSSLLIVFGDKLFGVGKALSAAEIEAAKFSLSINGIKESIDFFFANLDFENRLTKLTNKLKFGDKAEIFNLGLDKKTADKVVSDTNREISDASLRIAELINNSIFLLSKEGRKLSKSFFSALQTGVEVPDDLVKKLSDQDQKVFQILNQEAVKINKLTEQNTKARRLGAETDIQIEIQKAEDLKKALEKQKDAFTKFQNDVIARAKQFNSEFGSTFVVPDLEESFFVNKAEVFKRAIKELGDVQSFLEGNLKALQIKIPIQADFELLPITEPTISQDIIDGFFKGIAAERKIPIEIVPDISMDKVNTDLINLKTNFLRQFKRFGDFGLKEFFKIDFTDMRKGLDEAAAKLQEMQLISDTLAQSVTSGLTNAFNSLFDAILEGRNAIKALGSAVKALVVETIKAVVQMFILKAITTALFPASAGAVGGFSLPRGQYLLQANPGNFGQLSGIGSRAFNNVIQIVGQSTTSGSDIVTVWRRETNSQGRFG